MQGNRAVKRKQFNYIRSCASHYFLPLLRTFTGDTLSFHFTQWAPFSSTFKFSPSLCYRPCWRLHIHIYYYHVCMDECTPNLLSEILHQESHLNLIWGAERVAGWGIWEGILCRSYRRAGKRVWITEHSSSLENHVSSLCLFAQSFSFSLSAFLIFRSQSAPRIGLTEDFWVIVLGLCASCQERLPRLTWQLHVQGCGWHTLSY